MLSRYEAKGNPVLLNPMPSPSCPSFLYSPFLTCCAIYRPCLEERGPIWGYYWSHSPFIRLSPSWFSSAVRQMQGDLSTAPGSFHYHPYHYGPTRLTCHSGKWTLARNPDKNWWHRHILKLFWSQPMAPWTTGYVLLRVKTVTIWLNSWTSCYFPIPLLSFCSKNSMLSISTALMFSKFLPNRKRVVVQGNTKARSTGAGVVIVLTPWLMEPVGSMPQSQGLSNNPYPELNQPNYPHWYLSLQGPF